MRIDDLYKDIASSQAVILRLNEEIEFYLNNLSEFKDLKVTRYNVDVLLTAISRLKREKEHLKSLQMELLSKIEEMGVVNETV